MIVHEPARALRRAFAATCCALFVLPAALAAAPLDFDRAFNARGERPRLHYRASYELNGSTHVVEVWRDGDRRLRRRTDDRIETYVEKAGVDGELHLTVLDLRRRIRSDLERTDLARAGHFTDWFGLANALARPNGAYQLHEIDAPVLKQQPIAACRWYQLTQGGIPHSICWSRSARIPLLIADADGNVQWRVSELATGALPKSTFEIVDRGFAKNDAHRDIDGD